MGRVLPFRPRASDDWLPPPRTPAPLPAPATTSRPRNPYAAPMVGGGRRRARPRRGLRRGIAAALVVLVAGCVLVALHARGGSREAAHSTLETPTPSSPSSPPTTSGQPVTWTTRQGIDFPVSATSGPSRPEGLVAAGFAHDDLGAAIAAAWIVFQASPSPGPAVYRAALASHVTGPATQALAGTVAADYASAAADSHVAPDAPLGDGTTSFTGYRVEAMPSGNRHVTVYERAPDANGVDQVFTLDVALTWAGGDWKVIAPASGTWATAFAQLPALPEGVTVFTPAAGAR